MIQKKDNTLKVATITAAIVLVLLLVVIFVLPMVIREPAQTVEATPEKPTVQIAQEVETEASTDEFFVDPIDERNIVTVLTQRGYSNETASVFAEELSKVMEDVDGNWELEVHTNPTPWVVLLLWDEEHLAAQMQLFYGGHWVLYNAVDFVYQVHFGENDYSYSPKYIELTMNKMSNSGDWVWTQFETAMLLAVLEYYAPFESYTWSQGCVETELFNVGFSEGIFTLQNKDDNTINKINLYADVTGLTVDEIIRTDPKYHTPEVINDEVVSAVVEEMELGDYEGLVLRMFNEYEKPIVNYWFLETDAEFIYLKTVRPNVYEDDGIETSTLAHASKVEDYWTYN